MSDQPNEQTIVADATVSLSVETLNAALKVTEEKPKSQSLDPYILFTQIDDMRKEGIDEETIREAFNQFMASRMDTSRKAVNSMKRTPDSVPMPSQDDINKMYTARFESVVAPSEAMQTIIDALEQSRETRSQVVQAAGRPTLKMLTYRALYFGLTKFLAVVVYVFNKLGVK
jgi:beta-phosphoglucomutase-like phosphatase (HAD superfamily)